MLPSERRALEEELEHEREQEDDSLGALLGQVVESFAATSEEFPALYDQLSGALEPESILGAKRVITLLESWIRFKGERP